MVAPGKDVEVPFTAPEHSPYASPDDDEVAAAHGVEVFAVRKVEQSMSVIDSDGRDVRKARQVREEFRGSALPENVDPRADGKKQFPPREGHGVDRGVELEQRLVSHPLLVKEQHRFAGLRDPADIGPFSVRDEDAALQGNVEELPWLSPVHDEETAVREKLKFSAGEGKPPGVLQRLPEKEIPSARIIDVVPGEDEDGPPRVHVKNKRVAEG